ncbi:MAG: ankyrin repeat domain-containing protein [Chthoniobacteraceae bacterium]
MNPVSDIPPSNQQNSDMDKKVSDLTSRYYTAERWTWILGISLIIWIFGGGNIFQNIPILGITLAETKYCPHIVFGILAANVILLYIEWNQAERAVRGKPFSIFRFSATLLFSAIVTWLILPTLLIYTKYSGTFQGWYYAAVAIGILLGKLFSVLALVSLAIRSKGEVKNLGISRIPIVTKCTFKLWGPCLLVIILLYFLLTAEAPQQAVDLISYLAQTFFLLSVIIEYGRFAFGADRQGRRVCYRERVAMYKKIFLTHDYQYFLKSSKTKEIFHDLGVRSQTPVHDLQQAIQQYAEERETHFYVEVHESIPLETFPIDGNSDNNVTGNIDIRAIGDKKSIRVTVKWADGSKGSQLIDIPTNSLIYHAKKYISDNGMPKDRQKFISYIINQSAIDIVAQNNFDKKEPYLLYRIAATNNLDNLNRAIACGADLNEITPIGWTALLIATAQNYFTIARKLLESGADPDLANLSKATPLMLAAFYNNINILNLLIEYGANLNLQDIYGRTALMTALCYKHEKAAEILLDAGTDINISSRTWKKALNIAQNQGLGKIAKKIRLIRNRNN